MPYKPAIEGLDFFRNFSLGTGDGRWLRLHGENSSQDADINIFNAGARLGQSEAGKDFTVWRHATWDGATPSDQYIKIGFDGGGSPYAHIKTDSVYRGINIEGLQVYSESGINDMWVAGATSLSLMGSSYVNIHFGTRGSSGSRYFSFGQNGSHLVFGLQGGDYLDIGGRYVTFSASQGSVSLGETGGYYPPSLNHYVRDWAGDGATWYVNYAYDGYTAHTYQVTRSNSGILAFDIQFPVKTTELIINTTGTIHSTYNAFGTYFYNLIQVADSSMNMYFRAGIFNFSLNNGNFGADSYMLTMNETNFNFAGTNGAERGIRFRFTSNIIFSPAGGGGVGPAVVPENDASFDLGYERDATHRVRWRNLFLSGYATGGIDNNFTVHLGDALGATKLSIQDSTPTEVASVDSDGNITIAGVLKLTGSTSDPSAPPDGTVWHRTDLDEIRVRLNATTYKLVVNPI